MKLFFKYIYQQRFCVAILLLFSIIFCEVLYLYSSHPEAVIYASMLCGVIGCIIIIFRFIRFRKRHILLREIYENLPLMLDSLPAPEDLIQEDLNAIIKRLGELNRENLSRIKSAQQQNMDYYTVWVHQIKTPIAAMQMILQSEDTPTNIDLSAELFRIEQYAEMALHYIRLDSISTDYLFREYDLDKIIKKAVHRYAPQFIRRKIKLIYSPVQAKVLTDEKWLLFIIEQLLSNAIKYTAPGGKVSIEYSDNQLSVSDTGIGISDEDIPRIFEKGYTGLSGRSGYSDKKSTGLGLYLCRKTADNLGHKLYVNSTVGKGSVFTIDLKTDKIDIE